MINILGFGVTQNITTTQVSFYIVNVAVGQCVNEWCVPIRTYLWTLNFEFLILSICHEMFIFNFPPNYLRMQNSFFANGYSKAFGKTS